MRGIFPVLFALLASVRGSVGLPAESISESVERYANASLAENAVAVSDARLTIGHLELSLKHGVLSPVVAGREEIGFFFRGEGSWKYVSKCPEEFAVLKEDAGEVTRWKPQIAGGDATVAEDFSELLWLSPGKAEWPSGGDARPAPQSDFRKHRDYFSRLRYMSAAQRVAYTARSGASGRFAWAEFSGGKNEGIYVHDPNDKQYESLWVLKKAELDAASAKPEYYVIPISEQPIGFALREGRKPGLVLSRVEAEIEADGEHVHIATRQTFIPIDKPVRLLSLNLQNRVFANNSADIRHEKLLKIQTESGQEVSFDHRSDHLLIELPDTVPVNQEFTLRFEMEGDFLYRPESDSYWDLGFETWYPQPDLGAAAFTWKCRVKVKKPFVPIASGMTLERKEDGDWNTLTVEIDKPVILPIVMAGKYNIEEIKKDGRTIRVASYAYKNRRAAEHLATLASQIIKFYEPFLGPFPWPELTIVEANSYGFGVAPPAMMFITREAFSPHEDDLTKIFSQGLNERFAHELAHQYWGHQVKWPSDEEEWLSESFAEYCAALLIKAERGEREYRSLIAQFEGQSKESSKYSSLATANRLAGEGAFRNRINLLYGKGPWLLAVLHKEMGDERFLTFLKTFQSNLKWRFCSTALAENLLEYIAKRSYKDFFDRYYWGTETPKMTR